jgi:hypothetical protein
MIIIIKTSNLKKIKALELSTIAYPANCRIYDLAGKLCYDNIINRVRFYRTVIEKLIINNHNIVQWNHTEVSNTLHNRLIRFFTKNNYNVFLVELTEVEYDLLFGYDNLLAELNNLEI